MQINNSSTIVYNFETINKLKIWEILSNSNKQVF